MPLISSQHPSSHDEETDLISAYEGYYCNIFQVNCDNFTKRRHCSNLKTLFDQYRDATNSNRNRSLDALKNKWSALCDEFKTVTDSIRRTGSGGLPGQARFVHYDQMFDILKDDPNVFPHVELDSMRPGGFADLGLLEEDEGTRRGQPRRRHDEPATTATTGRQQRLTAGHRDMMMANMAEENERNRQNAVALFASFNDAANARIDRLLQLRQAAMTARSQEWENRRRERQLDHEERRRQHEENHQDRLMMWGAHVLERSESPRGYYPDSPPPRVWRQRPTSTQSPSPLRPIPPPPSNRP
ncbi:hypothetical protein BC941DRAFT_476882 [Chlamydoabsidia padenii]|nr:hypothetical protein BC941DRAFT_476882 [Chlamydoabsidia padenii]